MSVRTRGNSTTSSPATEPAARPLRLRVLERIRDEITSGRIAPGERLVERELCEWLAVSRPLIRESFRQLESEGLITVVPFRGPIVSVLGPREVESIYEARARLEGLAARLFAEKADEHARTRLNSAWLHLKQLYGGSDADALVRAKSAFYEILLAGGGNTVLPLLLGQLHARVMLLRSTSMQLPGRSAESMTEISAIVDAIERRDPEAADNAAVDHVRRAAAAAFAVLKVAHHFGSASRPRKSGRPEPEPVRER